MTQQKTITIAIGVNAVPEPTVWHIVDTKAPKNYDGFGTFTINEYYGTRTVLIRAEHFQWQTARYSSGIHGWEPTLHDEGDIAEAIWHRIREVQP
jgi:hypothetical protein